MLKYRKNMWSDTYDSLVTILETVPENATDFVTENDITALSLILQVMTMCMPNPVLGSLLILRNCWIFALHAELLRQDKVNPECFSMNTNITGQVYMICNM